MTWALFWASVFPAYLGAIGSIAASAVAVVAFIREIRTRKGLKEIAQSSSATVELPQSTPTLLPGFADPRVAQPLELVAQRRGTVVRNLTPEPIEIIGIRVPSGGKEVTFTSALPSVVRPGEGLGFIVRDLMEGPALAALLVDWSAADGKAYQSRFFV